MIGSVTDLHTWSAGDITAVISLVATAIGGAFTLSRRRRTKRRDRIDEAVTQRTARLVKRKAALDQLHAALLDLRSRPASQRREYRPAATRPLAELEGLPEVRAALDALDDASIGHALAAVEEDVAVASASCPQTVTVAKRVGTRDFLLHLPATATPDSELLRDLVSASTQCRMCRSDLLVAKHDVLDRGAGGATALAVIVKVSAMGARLVSLSHLSCEPPASVDLQGTEAQALAPPIDTVAVTPVILPTGHESEQVGGLVFWYPTRWMTLTPPAATGGPSVRLADLLLSAFEDDGFVDIRFAAPAKLDPIAHVAIDEARGSGKVQFRDPDDDIDFGVSVSADWKRSTEPNGFVNVYRVVVDHLPSDLDSADRAGELLVSAIQEGRCRIGRGEVRFTESRMPKGRRPKAP